MPSRDPVTKRRLSGAAQRRKAATSKALAVRTAPEAELVDTLPIPAAFGGVQPPPYAGGVDAVEGWAADVNLRAALAADGCDEYEAARIHAVVQLCGELGKTRRKARAAEKILRLRQVRLFDDAAELDVKSPPYGDPVAIVGWSYLFIARLIHEAATATSWLPDPRAAIVLKSLAGARLLACESEHRAIVDRIKSGG